MLVDLFEEVRQSPRLQDVVHWSIGDATELDKLKASPGSVWVPTRDDFGPPDMLGDLPDVQSGRRVHLESIALRRAGCNIHLFTPYGPKGIVQMEDLIRRMLLALRDSLNSVANYEVRSCTWYPREAISQQTTEAVLPIQLFVPVWDEIPAQLVGATHLNLK